jgi:protein-disulfide isomerase
VSQTQWEAVLTTPVDGTRDHIQGSADAQATLVQYGDYECPYCGEAYPVIKEMQARMGGRLRFVFRNFPISTSHPTPSPRPRRPKPRMPRAGSGRCTTCCTRGSGI